MRRGTYNGGQLLAYYTPEQGFQRLGTTARHSQGLSQQASA